MIGAHSHACPQQEYSPALWIFHDDILVLLRLESMGWICLHKLVGEVHLPEEPAEVYQRLRTERTLDQTVAVEDFCNGIISAKAADMSMHISNIFWLKCLITIIWSIHKSLIIIYPKQ